MTAGYTPQQSLIGGESRRLADADLGEGDKNTGEDHFAHATGKTCKACGRTIEDRQPAAAAKRIGCTTSVLSSRANHGPGVDQRPAGLMIYAAGSGGSQPPPEP